MPTCTFRHAQIACIELRSRFILAALQCCGNLFELAELVCARKRVCVYALLEEYHDRGSSDRKTQNDTGTERFSGEEVLCAS